ncbi:MAG TPA: hypothetical protein VIL55_02235 [Naasia sp.]|jgi:hypothetical protein
MSPSHLVAFLAASEQHVELPMPAFMYGLIFAIGFTVLALVMWSYRNVANRHSQVSGQPGGDGSGHGTAKDG